MLSPLSALSPSSALSPASVLSPAPRPPSFHAEETPARRLRPRPDDGPSEAASLASPPAWTEAPPSEAASPSSPPAGLEARREDGAWAETMATEAQSPSSPWDEAPQSEVASPSSPTAWAETLEELRADPDSPIGQLVFAEDDAADADAASAARERRELENRDAATVRALELAVARAEAATAGRAEAEAALAEVEARAFDVQRATRNLEADVERLTGERDAATAALHAATPSKKDHAARALEELEGVRSELDNSQAARAAALRELQRGIRRVRASRFWFQDDPASLVFRDVAAALGAVGCPAEEPCRTFDEGDSGACIYCGHPRDAHALPTLDRAGSPRWNLVPPPSPIKSPASS